MQNKEIADTIWYQMRAIDKNLVMCMGVTKLCVIEQGLQFNVNGLSFKGMIKITLNWRDTYDVEFLKLERSYYVAGEPNNYGRGKRYVNLPKQFKKFTDIYVEDLMPLLEREVENREKTNYAQDDSCVVVAPISVEV